MKRILIFSLAYYPHIGGAEVAVKEITDRITDIGFDMITMRWARDEPREEVIGNVRVYRVGPPGASRWHKLFFQFNAARVALTLHAKQHYAAQWALMAHSAGVPAALFKIWCPRIPFILTLQEGDPLEHIERTMLPLWPLFARAFTSADVLQSISTFLEAWGKRMGFKGKSFVIPNAVNTKLFAGEQVPHAGTVLITTSRLVHKNATDDVIRALPLMPDVTFRVLGVGPDEKKLRLLAEELGVIDRVEFVGFVPLDKIPAHLHRADIFVRPSRSEGMGNSFVEAMAAGLPVIATQEGGIADFLFDARRNSDKPTTGWAVDRDSPQQIAEAVKDIMNHQEKVLMVVNTAREMVVKKYDWDLIAKDMREKVFANLL